MAYIQLGDVCNVVKGEIGITKAIPGEYPMVTTREERKSHNSFQLDTKAVLVPLVSATGHGHASIKRIHYQEGKFAFGSILAACIPKDESYSAEFLYIYFQLMKDYVLVPLMKGSANVSLTLTNLKTAKVPDVSIEIQKDIIQLYSKLRIEQGQAIDILSSQKNDIVALKQAILQEAVKGKLTEGWRANNPNIEPASELLKRIEAEKQQLIAEKKIKKEKPLPLIGNDEVPYEVPETWVWCRLIDISSINGGFAFKSSNYVDEGARVIRISDFDEQGFKNQKVVRYAYTDDLFQYVLEDRNILIAMTGGTVGKSLFVNKVDELMVVNQRVATIKIIQPIFEAYVNCVIPTRLIQDVIEEAKNSTNDNISMSDIKGFNIPLPPLEEQKNIVEKVNSLMALCDELEQQIKTSQTQIEQLMQSCLKEVFEHQSN